MGNPHNIAESQAANTQLADIELVDADPVDWWRWKPLILKIKALPSGRAIKKRRFTQVELCSFRASCTHLGLKVVIRNEPGATYIWNGNIGQVR